MEGWSLFGVVNCRGFLERLMASFGCAVLVIEGKSLEGEKSAMWQSRDKMKIPKESVQVIKK